MTVYWNDLKYIWFNISIIISHFINLCFLIKLIFSRVLFLRNLQLRTGFYLCAVIWGGLKHALYYFLFFGILEFDNLIIDAVWQQNTKYFRANN